MTMPEIPKRFLASFTRGYFDGDGSVILALAPGKTQKIIVKRLRVVFTSGSKKFLQQLSKALSSLGLDSQKVVAGHASFILVYPTRESKKIFRIFYGDSPQGLFLKRKFVVFGKYFKLRPDAIDRFTRRILQDNL